MSSASEVRSSFSADVAESRLAPLVLAVVTVLASLAVQRTLLINADVAFLAWAAKLMLGGAVYGVDVYEVNPPLAYMIYAPAALMAEVTGFDFALKLWVGLLAGLSVLVFWQCCDRQFRLALTVTLAVCGVFMLPSQFGQREHVSFLLVAPYVAGPSRSRSIGTLSGLMAGVGFALKPYFLIPLALVFATRRRTGREEWIIVGVGAAYALCLLVFFQPWLFTFLPHAWQTYWAVHDERETTWILTGLILLAAVPLSLAGTSQFQARGFLAATFGFVIAAFVQYKGFSYHFHAAWGFLALFFASRAYNGKRVVSFCAVGFLLAYGAIVGRSSACMVMLPDKHRPVMDSLLREIDSSPSFLAIDLASFPAFPTALYTRSQYRGLAIWPIFAAAALDRDGGSEINALATRLAFEQGRRELERRPDLVIVARGPPRGSRDEPGSSLLAWLRKDPGFAADWSSYRYTASVAGFDLYRRD